MVLSSQLVLSQKTEEKTEKNNPKQPKNKKTPWIDTLKKKIGVYLVIHLKTIPLI